MNLSLQHIHAGYGSTPVLRDVTIDIPASSVVAVLGPNGAGKTTLLRVASGLIRPKAGTVTFGATPLTGRPSYEFVAAGVHHVPEGRGIFPSLTVAENITTFSLPGKEDDAKALAVDAFPKLGQLLNRPAGTLSGGEQQMLALSRAYIRKPPIVLLDEVSMGLAPNLVDQIFAFLRRLASEGMAMCIVEQYVGKVLPVADHVYMLNHGELIFDGDPAELANSDVFARYLGAEAVA
jgi:branched-chain amino acid transport system ATP-binding protein